MDFFQVVALFYVVWAALLLGMWLHAHRLRYIAVRIRTRYWEWHHATGWHYRRTPTLTWSNFIEWQDWRGHFHRIGR